MSLIGFCDEQGIQVMLWRCSVRVLGDSRGGGDVTEVISYEMPVIDSGESIWGGVTVIEGVTVFYGETE